MTTIINGTALAKTLREEIKADVDALIASHGITPGLNLLLVGDDAASEVYVRNKGKDCEQVGIRSTIVRLPASTLEQDVVDIIEKWNSDANVHGILVQLPLPKHINERRVIETIDPAKDVDGFHPDNMGRLLIGIPGFVPCTPSGVIEMLKRYHLPTNGKHVVVVVGRSNIVGKPLAALLAQKAEFGNATVTLCHTGTIDLASYTKTADILIAAVGVAHIITADHVKPGAVVIDVGMNRVTNSDGTTKLTGDVDYMNVESIASAITPVPGGVGPMTRAMLLKNTLLAARKGANA